MHCIAHLALAENKHYILPPSAVAQKILIIASISIKNSSGRVGHGKNSTNCPRLQNGTIQKQTSITDLNESVNVTNYYKLWDGEIWSMFRWTLRIGKLR